MLFDDIKQVGSRAGAHKKLTLTQHDVLLQIVGCLFRDTKYFISAGISSLASWQMRKKWSTALRLVNIIAV
jgi:hypothetical protein